jgi:hypothetical protein
MALMIRDTWLGVSQSIALRRAALRPLASGRRIRPDAKEAIWR